MRRLLVVLMLMMSGQACGGWAVVDKDDTGATTYANPATIRREGDMVKMWSMIDYPSAQINLRSHRYFSQKQLAEYDCQSQRMRIHMLGDYFGPLGRGGLASTTARPEEWKPITSAGSISETLFKYACGK
jgi:hypothetical protein